jgi:hypothetical protein
MMNVIAVVVAMIMIVSESSSGTDEEGFQHQIDPDRIKIIIQIGAAHSASTVQFYTLCAIAVVKYGANRVSCAYDSYLEYDPSDHRVHVIKTQHSGHLLQILRDLKNGEGAVFQSMVSSHQCWTYPKL